MQNSIKNTFRALATWLQGDRLRDLLTARHHSSYLTRQRLATIVTRVRLVAIAFSVLTLVWIPLDATSLGTTDWQILAVCRVLASLVFLYLALVPVQEPTRARAMALLALMLAVPLSIYAVSQYLFAGATAQGLAAVNERLYDALPWVVLAGLSIFPLVAAEGLLLTVAITSLTVGTHLLTPGAALGDALTMLQVMLLMSGIYLLACAIQLHYMMALLHRASLDPLTGALTRRSGTEMMELHFHLAIELGQPLSVLFIDADHFKTINDQFGHEAGDQALKNIAATLHRLLRRGDIVIRWGGEEFVVALLNTPLAGAHRVVHNLTTEWFGQRPDGSTLTASIGLAERCCDEALDWVRLVELADQRMYAAKTAGRARCVGPDGARHMDAPHQGTA